jgi:hypothetical protein
MLNQSRITETATATKTVYPDGRHLESISLIPIVTQFPAQRVSDACECFVTFLRPIRSRIRDTVVIIDPSLCKWESSLWGSFLHYTKATTAITYHFCFTHQSHLTVLFQTSTTTVTTSSTLTGQCASETPYTGGYRLEPSSKDPGQNVSTVDIPNPYDCCKACQAGAGSDKASCLAWISTPGPNGCSVLQKGEPPAASDHGSNKECKGKKEGGDVFVDGKLYPDNLGGKGPCAGNIKVHHKDF